MEALENGFHNISILHQRSEGIRHDAEGIQTGGRKTGKTLNDIDLWQINVPE